MLPSYIAPPQNGSLTSLASSLDAPSLLERAGVIAIAIALMVRM